MVAKEEYAAYLERNIDAIKALLEKTGARPVLFLGCGITRRYLGAPSWTELLRDLALKIGIDSDRFSFISQKVGSNPAEIGEMLVDLAHEWAWGAGKDQFPQSYFSANVDKAIFLKFLAAEHIRSFGTFTSNSALVLEIELLKSTAPHAIITTNFDTLISDFFPDFELVVGERIIPMSMSITGEIYQIHGTVNDPATLVLTTADYTRFMRKRRYITSKMMMYFAEFPVFIVGYGLGDENVNSIISDLGEAMKDSGGLIENLYYVEWVNDVNELTHLKEEHVVPAEGGDSPPLRVKTIMATDFSWLFKTLADTGSPVHVNKKILRHLAARVINLVRADIPKNKVDIDYRKLEQLSEDSNQLALVLGITNTSNPNVTHPYCLTQVAQKLGYNHHNHAQRLIPAASKKVGFDIKSTDNEYHIAVKSGLKAINRKFSDKFVNLLKEVKSV